MRAGFLGILLLILAGCATTIPDGVRRAPPDAPDLRNVRSDPDAYAGAEVRWGGTIAGIDNRATQTCVEVVGRELQRNGRPFEDDRSQGRFMACVDDFLDPEIYQQGRQLTVRGVIEGVETHTVGAYPYRYPVVRVSAYQLWAPEPEPRPHEWGPYWDPFWHGPWPYRYPHPFYGPPGYPRW
ncbi:hypothetical protein CAI21_20225 [Alkalilimnicola ehrlichii]|uniref:Outer membrane lipoprotein Slp n=1 Tax=Alkalilimnicola ehrlichii TaxID=351052 RepID=A0A3E0WIW9_9GAMM|nr:Slp family lipoprotein [Alkalilimnicola ehrlichii]RFA24798.1 hypothetical protein CAI21_20225 [Alkalilimnicola ehrlichii]RFA32057.1 hypothetical protein CAL65_20685 [Alkalilimnicola ehrlichii]